MTSEPPAKFPKTDPGGSNLFAQKAAVPEPAADDSVQKLGRSCPGALELFAGSCKLSKCLKMHGFAAHGIDHKKCKNRVGPCVIMDLTKKKGQLFVKSAIFNGKVACVPMAPPCGTSSKARERPIPRWLRALGVPEPKPLRSSQYPLGFPWLKGKDRLRVELANSCYEFVAQVFTWCHECGIPCFIENPKNSRMWEVPRIAALFDLPGIYFSVFHSCMHGGSRDKATALLHNCSELCTLEVMCDQQHQHQKWGISKVFGSYKFDTSEEAEYPLILCQRISRCFAQACRRQGWDVQLEPKAAPAAKVVPAHWRIAGGRQPRGKAAPTLLPEDFQVVSFHRVSLSQHTFLKRIGRVDQILSSSNVLFPKGRV